MPRNVEVATEFVERLWRAVSDSHRVHVNLKGADKWPEHESLGEFYKGLPDMIDSFTEVFLSRYPSVTLSDFDPLPPTTPMPANGKAILIPLRDWIDANRDAITPHRELQNKIDEILGLIGETIYKLRFTQ